MRRIVLLLVLTSTVAAAIPAAVVPAAAQAATYAVWSCADPLGQPLSVGDWTPSTNGTQAASTTTCGANVTGSTPGNLQSAAGAGPTQPDTGVGAAWTINAAPGTTISAFDVWWTNSASVQVPGRVSIITNAAVLYARDAGSFGNVGLPFADGNHQTFTGFSASSTAIVAQCVSSCASPNRAIASVLNAYRLKVTVSDTTAPTGEASGLSEGMSVAGPVPVQARASDVGGGVRDLQLVADGRVVDSRAGGGQCDDVSPTTGDANEYTVMHPCPAQLPAGEPATFTVTPAVLGAAGAHNVSVVSHDAAGNAGTLLSNTVVVAPATVDGPAPPSRYDPVRHLFFNPDVDLSGPARPNGVNAGPAAATLLFATKVVRRVHGKRRVVTALSRKRTVGYSTTARLRGRVVTPTGAPIVGAHVWRATSVAGAAWRISGAPLTTSKTGRVSVKLPARSPSRRIKLVYFPATDSNVSSSSKSASLAVRAPVSLSVARRVVPRGGRISLTARLRAGRRPGRSVLGVLQVRKPSGWETVRQLRFSAARGGRGVAQVVLRLRTPAAYRFRVSVSAQSSLRYTRGVSAARSVRVR